jgi:hypothetical protein
MTKPRRPERKWHSPQALADRANDGFLSVVRSTGWIVRSVPSDIVNGVSQVGQALIGRKRRAVKQQTKPLEAAPPQQDASPRAAAGARKRQASSPGAPEAAEPARSARSQVTAEEPTLGEETEQEGKKMVKPQTKPLKAAPPQQDASPKAAAGARKRQASSPGAPEAAEPARSARSQVTAEEPTPGQETEQEGPQRPSLDIEALVKEHSPPDTVQAIMLRKALDDLLHGSEEASEGALKTLVGLGQVAEPFLVACLRKDSPHVVEIALEGLSQLGSQRLIGSISDVLGSSDPELRIVALRAVGRLPDDQQRPLLERGLRDPAARVRRRALFYLSWHDSSWAVAEIMRLCDDQQPDVQWAAVDALMALRPSQACDHLQLMMPSLDPVYQRRAALLLQRRKDSPGKNPHKSVDAQSSAGRSRKRRKSKQPSGRMKTKEGG